MGQTSESLAVLLFLLLSAMGVKTLSNCTSFSASFFLPLSLPCVFVRAIMLGMSAEHGLKVGHGLDDQSPHWLGYKSVCVCVCVCMRVCACLDFTFNSYIFKLCKPESKAHTLD